MGHRALLAYRREAGDSLDAEDGSDGTETGPELDSAAAARYDLHRSHWGGADFALRDSLSADDPFAADTSFAVDPEPVATDLPMADAVANHLDFLHHEAFYRVSRDYETTAFHVLWFGFEADAESVERSETVGHGALVEAVPEDANYLRGWFRGTKAVVGDLLDGNGSTGDAEDFTPEGAAAYLIQRVETWSEDREVILPE